MATVDNGTQDLSFDYYSEAKSENFNKLNFGIQSTGIYSGGVLVQISNTLVEVEPFISFIEDSDKLVGVKLKTSTNAEVPIQASTPFIVIRFSWKNLESNYADIMAISSGDLLNDDLIIGRAIFSGATLEDFDYNCASIPILSEIETDPLFVKANLLYDNKVQINAGVVVFNGQPVEYAGGQSPVFDLPVTDGRKDLVCLDSTGSIVIVQGVDSGTPTIPAMSSGQEFLGLITFPTGATFVKGSYIQSYRNVRNNYT